MLNFSNLSKDNKDGIHEVLFQIGILNLNDDNKVEKYYNKLPDKIKKEGVNYGFNDTVVQEMMSEWFKNNIS